MEITRVFNHATWPPALAPKNPSPTLLPEKYVSKQYKSDHGTLLTKALPLISIIKFTGVTHSPNPMTLTQLTYPASSQLLAHVTFEVIQRNS